MSDLSDINKSDTDSDESVSEAIFTVRNVTAAETLACCCYDINDSDQALQLMLEMMEDNSIQTNLS
jgi:Tfp pilus assembly protein FimV